MIDIKEIAINERYACFYCGNNTMLRNFVKECQNQKIVFKKSGQEEHIHESYFKYNQDTALIIYFENLDGKYELHFYSRRRSNHYDDWGKFYHINYLEIAREDKLNQILN